MYHTVSIKVLPYKLCCKFFGILTILKILGVEKTL